MDDLKMVVKSDEELQKQIQIVKTFSDYIHMEFELEKCAKLRLKEAKNFTRKI